ncbi:peptidase M23 [Actinoplanes sp. SE50]|uniref:M23 family metallopeptidase n=1 Tax=unclassified Actinoplanes TaxID=2626549 RepID=UPI00023EBE6A|nr:MULTISPECIES: M23 family metallopeptidase [unclassified Actinoplanes]AEV81788.1 peptidase M23 [Actinoplanes sp. SE50/110]ATO80189.1 peptidase M23 [Actinoplanes sp. SE50]SLL97593.1 peptidase M23 [Actinoplanes sp. SE50/110]
MRQRLSSEPDRYRGRRRVPTPPRSRYAAVGAAAFVGAGIVAIGAASNLPDSKTVNPDVLSSLDQAQTQVAADALQNRAGTHASRSENRDAAAKATTKLSDDEVADAYLLPLDDYEFTAPFGVRFGKLHAGIDLAAPDGTPYKAIHAGEVTAAGYNGGYGYSITVKQSDGTEVIYAHSRRLLVKKGDTVKAGQVIGEVGNTGYSYGTHLHLEIHVGGTPVDPISFLKPHGVDIQLQLESVYAAQAASLAAS